jgi:hypothetical protein
MTYFMTLLGVAKTLAKRNILHIVEDIILPLLLPTSILTPLFLLLSLPLSKQ